MENPDEGFRIRKFTLVDGREVRLYCRLVKVRVVIPATYRLYLDHQGQEWLDIAAGNQSCLIPLIDESFEQRVAAELLTLGLNKYSG